MKLFMFAIGIATACSSKYSPTPPSTDDDPEVDAGPVVMPDAEPQPKPYPSGPYGTGSGDTIVNLSWQGYADTDVDTDTDPFNENPHAVTLEDFYAERDSGSKILLVTNSAGWCGACQEEAAELADFAAKWVPQGVRFLTAMIENGSGSPASVAFAKSWGVNFGLTTPVVADPDVLLDPYYVDNGIPFNLFIETKTMTIVSKMSGFDSTEAEQIFRAHVD
jgi:thiol-disulfide isomerase/thioredoxin